MTVRDEVCGMEFDADKAKATLTFGGARYHFCSQRCKHQFTEHPGWYVPVKPGDKVGT